MTHSFPTRRSSDLGAGWNRTGERAGAFIAVQIDDPAFAVPLRANLLRASQKDGEHHLLWSRPSARERSRSEEHTSELQSLMRISYAVFCLKKKKKPLTNVSHTTTQAPKQLRTH